MIFVVCKSSSYRSVCDEELRITSDHSRTFLAEAPRPSQISKTPVFFPRPIFAMSILRSLPELRWSDCIAVCCSAAAHLAGFGGPRFTLTEFVPDQPSLNVETDSYPSAPRRPIDKLTLVCVATLLAVPFQPSNSPGTRWSKLQSIARTFSFEMAVTVGRIHHKSRPSFCLLGSNFVDQGILDLSFRGSLALVGEESMDCETSSAFRRFLVNVQILVLTGMYVHRLHLRRPSLISCRQDLVSRSPSRRFSC